MEHVNVVVSGFDSQEGSEGNPSHMVVDQLGEEGAQALAGHDDDTFRDVQVSMTSVMLPISIEKAWPTLESALDAGAPNVVVATGFNSSARGILLERCAVNLIDTLRNVGRSSEPSRIFLETGDRVEHGPINADGPAAFWTRLPLRAILDDFGRDEIPAALSSDAGTYVSNSVFYNLMQWAAGHHRVIAGFVSLPSIVDASHARHGLSITQQVCALNDVVCEAVRYYFDPSSSDILID